MSKKSKKPDPKDSRNANLLTFGSKANQKRKRAANVEKIGKAIAQKM